MIYHSLARFYDQLVKDEEATEKWVQFTQRYIKASQLLELACGSGEITVALSQAGYHVMASDLSLDMLEEAKGKDIGNKIEFFQADMTDFSLSSRFDGILCYCDSVNYLHDEAEFEKLLDCVLAHLKPAGVFLFDMHTPQRLKEFEEEYIEEGILDEVQYQWTIQSDENTIHHHFSFWLPNGQLLQESHRQIVFDPNWVLEQLEARGLKTECWTDFDQPGIKSGEKIFIAGRKNG